MITTRLKSAGLAAAATVLCSMAAAPAMAQAPANPSGPLVGVGWGRFNVDVDSLADAGTTANRIVNSNDNAWKAFAGWRFNPYVSLELAYINLGSPGDRFEGSGSNGNYRLDVSGFSPSVIGTLPLDPVELFAKAGRYFYDVTLKVNLDAPLTGIRSRSSRDDLIYGGGVGVTLAERLHLRAEYEVIDLKNASNSDALWLSAAWRF
jgi:hypothetical protein